MDIQKRINNEGLVQKTGCRSLPRSNTSSRYVCFEMSRFETTCGEVNTKLQIISLKRVWPGKYLYAQEAKTIRNPELSLCFDDFGTVFVMKTKLTPEETCRESWSEKRVLVCNVSHGSREKKGFVQIVNNWRFPTGIIWWAKTRGRYRNLLLTWLSCLEKKI